MTVKVDIDTSQEGTDKIAHAVAGEMFGSTASPGLRLEVRKIVLTVAEMMKSDRARRPNLYPQTESHGSETGEQS